MDGALAARRGSEKEDVMGDTGVEYEGEMGRDGCGVWK